MGRRHSRRPPDARAEHRQLHRSRGARRSPRPHTGAESRGEPGRPTRPGPAGDRSHSSRKVDGRFGDRSHRRRLRIGRRSWSGSRRVGCLPHRTGASRRGRPGGDVRRARCPCRSGARGARRGMDGVDGVPSHTSAAPRHPGSSQSPGRRRYQGGPATVQRGGSAICRGAWERCRCVPHCSARSPLWHR